MILIGRTRRLLLGIGPSQTSLARRGFASPSPSVQHRLETIGATFVDGYHAALEAAGGPALTRRLDAVEAERRGWAYEGAAMALALLDLLWPFSRGRLARFLAGPGAAHAYMVHVGAGWALARLRRGPESWPERSLGRPDPLLRWLLVDGYGFHEGYFRWPRYRAGATPRVGASARAVFDQGLGRSLWFVCGAAPARIAEAIEGMAPARRDDLWSGVGLAAAYAGGVERGVIAELADAAGAARPHVAQGAAFAAKARDRAGNAAGHTELATGILCGMSALEAAAVTDDALAALPSRTADGAFEAWRAGVRRRFAAREVCA